MKTRDIKSQPSAHVRNHLELRVSVTYGLVAVAWILFSDKLVGEVVPDAARVTNFQTYKGLAFVLVTALLLYAVLGGWLRRREREQAERRQVEDRVRQLSHAVEQSPASIVITDTRGNIEYVNRKFTEVTGYSVDEARGKNPRILKSGDWPREKYGQLWSEITNGRTWRGEFHNRKKNGELFWEWASISPILNEDGRVTHFVAVKEDITERKRVEDALRTSEERFRSLIENASDIITVLNNACVIRFQSPSVERVLGYRPEAMVGRGCADFVHSDDLARLNEALSQALAEPGKPASAEFRIRHRDGSWRILHSIGRSIPTEVADGYIIVNSRDVTESRALEEQLRQSQKMDAVGRLAGGVAHDFNNVLAVIQMQVELLKMEGKLLPGQLDFANEIGKAAQRAANLTGQLLLFSRRQTMKLSDFDLNENISNISKMLRRIVGEDVRMQLSFSPQPLFIHADSGMMDQVLMNLAVNSRDAMPNGGLLVIETSAADFDDLAVMQCPNARPGAFVCLGVADTGNGIAPDVLPRIFEPFYTTKGVGKGTGLGLATVFGIVQQHQGWIDVRSEPGRGTTFRVYLPRLAQATGGSAVEAAPQILRRGSETILLVEDESALRASLLNVLTHLGYRVFEAASGVSALEVWSSHRDEIDLLLTDLVMPDGISGAELSERLLKESRSLKVVYMSGYSPEVASGKLALHDGENFLIKPFPAGRLAETLRRRLDHGGVRTPG